LLAERHLRGLLQDAPVQPLILTLALDEASQQRFDVLRAAHFPPERNHLAAHVTLFHALPGENEDEVRRDVAQYARRGSFDLRVAGLRSLGRGVAYVLESEELAAIRAGLAQRWQPWLSAQDRHKHSPHITVQNKVTPEQARALLADLEHHFTPFAVTAQGLALWRYLGGPWEPLARQPFSAPA
jgi:2'-5' RNA ligase